MYILRIHDIFSACAVWFTFVSRTQEHRAVGSSGIGLTDSRESFPLWGCLSLTLYLDYITLKAICQTFFERQVDSNHQPSQRQIYNAESNRVVRSLSSTSLCTLIVSYSKGFVKRFFELFCSVGRFCFTSPNYALGRGCSLLSAS